ncbi:MAG: AbrB/MazE/SpoVT family DNA-binding domain-containing protein [Oscillospiraceae bacterium]|nr:AbrB/MazE/SpoVT family DNA-binding domain-containing protein [Oscillospiraceae bacterium]
MMEMAKVTSKGQITIPISIRRRLSINEGDKILFINRPDGVMMVNPDLAHVDMAEYAATATPVPADVETSAAPASSAASETSPAPPAPPAAATPVAPPATPAAPRAAAPSIEPPVRKYIPPAEEDENEKPVTTGGIDLSSLLDDIRSIGSNI